MRTKIVLVVCLLILTWGGSAKADELTELKQQMQQMQQRLEQLESQQNQQSKQMAEQISKAVEEKQIGALPDSLKWAENIKWSGDLRYRHESIDDDTATTKRDRNRIRARLKMEAKINDEWDAILRLASGSSDSPTSTNQTLGDSGSDSFSSKEIWLDWAYADYHPAWKPGLNILLGKMGNPFYTVGKNQLIFDGDLSPEGGAAKYAWNLTDLTSAKLTGGAFWLRERSTDADTSIFGIQGLLKHKLSDDSHILGGISYYDFGNIQGQSLSGISASGNTTSGGLYVNDYDILEGFAEYGFKLGDVPASVFGSYVNNIAASTSEDTAWLIGAKYNKAKKPGSWEVSYNYRDVEKDAAVGGLCDSDFIGGGTDGTGHVLGFKYQLAKNVQAGLSYFMNEKNASSTRNDYKLLQADLVFKF
ncbi:MAG: putative porin [Planctomycetota bacterium]